MLVAINNDHYHACRDQIARINPLIIEMERQCFPLLVIAHTAVLRVVLSYFLGTQRDELPHMDMPLHTVIQLSRGPVRDHTVQIQLLSTARLPLKVPCVVQYGCEVERFKLGVGANDLTRVDSLSFGTTLTESEPATAPVTGVTGGD